MTALVERLYFLACLAFGRLLRASRYSKTTIVRTGNELLVRKRRRFYAPLLIWMSEPLVRILNTGVRVLPQREWEKRESQLYESLIGGSIRIESDGALILPCIAGKTLAMLLEDPDLHESIRKRAIDLAVAALAEFHARGFTHGDAMAENLMIDLDTGVAQPFDFETIHDPSRSMAWRRADDVRALLATCLVRTVRDDFPKTVEQVLGPYGDKEVSQLVSASFTSVWQRPLAFHLGQAALSFQDFREIDRLMRDWAG